MKFWMLAALLLVAGCNASPTAPTPPPVVNVPPPPPVVVVPPPVIITPPAPVFPPNDPRFDLTFYRDFAHGVFSYGGLVPLSRLIAAPRIFLNTHDDAGRPIDERTLDRVAATVINTAGIWGGGQFGLAGLERGQGTRQGESGWLTIKWDSGSIGFCGTTTGLDGGVMTFYYRRNCGCSGFAIRPAIVAHELGHAFGYYHTRNSDDVMTGGVITACDANPSDRERFHTQIAYSRALGSPAP